MNKLAMCRICLVKDVRMYIVAHRNLFIVYEKLTDMPFVTEDRRPILACFFCYAKLKQCYELLRQCLVAEERLAEMLNEDYEPNPFLNLYQLKVRGGFIKSATENIDIVHVVRTETIVKKEELPADSELQYETIKTEEEHQTHELEPVILPNSGLEGSESGLQEYVPLTVPTTKVVEQQTVPKKKRGAKETNRTTVAEKPKLDDTMTAGPTKKEKSNSQVSRIAQKPTSTRDSYFQDPNKCDQSHINQIIKNKQHSRLQICQKPRCERSFSHKGNLTKHIRIHTGEKPYECAVCQQCFTQKCNLIQHTRVHTGEKPFKCAVCPKSFRAKGTLTLHTRVHTGEKPFMCGVCQKSFSAKGALTLHILVHTGQKPHKCDVCQKSFIIKNTLTRHIRLHTGEKPYKCDVCQKSYSVKGTLKKHLWTHW